MTKVAVIGVGYVGLTTAVGLAGLGHEVIGLDTNEERVARLREGLSPIYEPGLDELLAEALESRRLRFTSDYADGITDADVTFICVPTPQDEDGSADMTYVLNAARAASTFLKPGAVLVTKSTVPVGSAERVAAAVGRTDVGIASNPEFLREGSAVYDFMNPDRIVIGASSPDVAKKVEDLYIALNASVVTTSLPSAELIKYASNTFLAVKLSFVNDLAALCAATGADVSAVAHGMGLDTRIGNRFLTPGPGWGGSCFPKDTRALNALAEGVGVPMPLVTAAISSNERAHKRIVDMVAAALPDGIEGSTIACWGLAFKAHTDDTRESPALAVIHRLLARGARVIGHDPIAHAPVIDGFSQSNSALEAARGADVLLVLTEWPEYGDESPEATLAVMRGTGVVDSRGLLNMETWRAAGARLTVLGKSI